MNSTIILSALKVSDPTFAHVHEFQPMGIVAFIAVALVFVAIAVVDPDKNFGRFRYEGRRY